MGVIIGIIILLIFKFDTLKQAIISPPSGWHYLVIGGFLASVVGQIFFYSALRTGEVSKVTPLGATYSLVSFLLGVLFLQESITATKIGGVICVVLGAILLK